MICLKERGRASGSALPGRAWERGMSGTRSEAEPLEMRYQAEPGNEELLCSIEILFGGFYIRWLFNCLTSR